MDCEVEQYCLRWKYHHSNLQFMFAQLLENQSLCDVTLACEGKTLRVHKIMLSACSAYFDSIFSKYEETDPIVILEGVKFEDIEALVEFMYRGEITVDKSKLNDLIETAEELQVKGLAAVSWRSSDVGWSSVSGNDANDDSDSSNFPNPINGSKRKFPESISDEKLSSQGNLSDDGLNYNYPVTGFSNTSQFRADAQSTVPIPNVVTSPVVKKRKLSDIPKVKSSNSLSENDSDCEKDIPSRLVKAAENALPVISNILSLTSAPEKAAPPLPPPADLTNLKEVVKMSDHIQQGGWRPHFWELESTRRVMEAIKTKKIEMKTGAEILGVTYGTLYGRYREIHGYLKQPQREFWHDIRYSDILCKLKKKEISIFKAADLMNITATALANHLAKTERGEPADDLGMPYPPDSLITSISPSVVPLSQLPVSTLVPRVYLKVQKDNTIVPLPSVDSMNNSLNSATLSVKPSALISKLTANKEVKLIKTDGVTFKAIKLEKPGSSTSLIPETSLIKISSSEPNEGGTKTVTLTSALEKKPEGLSLGSGTSRVVSSDLSNENSSDSPSAHALSLFNDSKMLPCEVKLEEPDESSSSRTTLNSIKEERGNGEEDNDTNKDHHDDNDDSVTQSDDVVATSASNNPESTESIGADNEADDGSNCSSSNNDEDDDTADSLKDPPLSAATSETDESLPSQIPNTIQEPDTNSSL